MSRPRAPHQEVSRPRGHERMRARRIRGRLRAVGTSAAVPVPTHARLDAVHSSRTTRCAHRGRRVHDRLGQPPHTPRVCVVVGEYEGHRSACPVRPGATVSAGRRVAWSRPTTVVCSPTWCTPDDDVLRPTDGAAASHTCRGGAVHTAGPVRRETTGGSGVPAGCDGVACGGRTCPPRAWPTTSC